MMSSELGNYSLDEINTNKDVFKRALIFYSANVKNYAKWFEINEINKNETSFTSYKVIYRFLPKDLNESIVELTVWKRFRDFKELFQIMCTYHVSLHRRDKFPEFVKSKFFGRFDDKVIEERRQCCLRLLQFIGSQAHLYKHEKFVEFLSDGGTFGNLQNSNGTVLKPTIRSEPVSNSTVRPGISTGIKSHLDELANEIDIFLFENLKQLQQSSNQSPNLVHYVTYAVDNLNKTKKLLSLALKNVQSDYTYATVKLLKSAANNLSDCIIEIEMNLKQANAVRVTLVDFLKSLYKKLSSCVENYVNNHQTTASITIEVGDGDSDPDGTLSTSSSASKIGPPLTASGSSSAFNDWILSDFNLVSNDFNNELKLISGKLFDLSFHYKLAKVLNANCFLMKQRHGADHVVLKRIKKSPHPTLSQKSLVPFNKRIPHMCSLLKYYESDSTIFLIVNYHQLGRLYPYLCLIRANIHKYPDVLNNMGQVEESVDGRASAKEQPFRRLSIGIMDGRRRPMVKSASSFTSLPKSVGAGGDNDAIKRRTQSQSIELLNGPIEKLKLEKVEIELDKIPTETTVFTSSSRSISSASSGSSTSSASSLGAAGVAPVNNTNNNEKVEFVTASNEPIAVFKNTKNDESRGNSPVLKQRPESPYLKLVKRWLAQLLCALKGLHTMGIIVKDLSEHNILLDSDGNLALTFISRWNLVDEKLSQDAINGYYTAPELTGMINNKVSESCDWWSFGIIAYELITASKFANVHQLCQLYANSIHFTDDFECDLGKDLIRKLLRINPNERLTLEQIQSHRFFSSIDWTLIEESSPK